MARATFAWRVALLAAAVTVETATHWPKLRVGQPDQPIDKLLHATSFGALAFLLLRACPSARRWILPAAMLAWAGADELTQGIPGLHRSVDLDDWLADAIGIALAFAFAGAFAAQGRGLARLLAQRRRVAAAWLLSRPMPWMHLATGAALGAAVGGPVAIWLDSLFIRKAAQPWQYGVIGGVLGAVGGAHLLFEFGVRAGLRRCAAAGACLRCGTAAPGAPAEAACAACGSARCTADWAPVASLPGSDELRCCLVPVLHGLLVLIALNVGGLAAVTAFRLDSPMILRIDEAYRSLPVDFRILMDAALLGLVGAWTAWRCRRRIAARIDAGTAACLACGFDLRAASGDACPECGAPIHHGPPAWRPPASGAAYTPAP